MGKVDRVHDQSSQMMVPALSVSVLVGLLDQNQLEADSALDAVGLTRAQLNDATAVITRRQEMAILHHFVRQTRRRIDVWRTAGQRYRLLSMNPVGFAQITSPTIGTAVALIHRFADLSYTLASYAPVEDAMGNVGLSLDYGDADEELVPFLYCRDTIAITNLFHDLWGSEFPFDRIELSARFGRDLAPDLRGPSQFAAGTATRWFWPIAIMDTPPAQADPVLHALYVGHAEELQAKARAIDGFVAMLESLIGKDIAGASLASLAKQIGLSRRTLQRELADRDLTFRDVRDRYRARLSRTLLGASDEQIGMIAEQVGYSDPSSFHRACLRWTGRSPQAFRRNSKTRAKETATIS